MCHTFAHRLVCPWCEKGEVLSNASQQVVISVRCPRCGHVFLADLLGLKTERAAAQNEPYINLLTDQGRYVTTRPEQR